MTWECTLSASGIGMLPNWMHFGHVGHSLPIEFRANSDRASWFFMQSRRLPGAGSTPHGSKTRKTSGFLSPSGDS